MSSALPYLMTWCPGTACDPCGCIFEDAYSYVVLKEGYPWSTSSYTNNSHFQYKIPATLPLCASSIAWPFFHGNFPSLSGANYWVTRMIGVSYPSGVPDGSYTAAQLSLALHGTEIFSTEVLSNKATDGSGTMTLSNTPSDVIKTPLLTQTIFAQSDCSAQVPIPPGSWQADTYYCCKVANEYFTFSMSKNPDGSWVADSYGNPYFFLTAFAYNGPTSTPGDPPTDLIIDAWAYGQSSGGFQFQASLGTNGTLIWFSPQ